MPIGEEKKKNHHVALWVTLIVIFVVIILPLGLIFGFLFDPAHTTSESLGVNTTGTEKKSFTDNLVVDMFDYTDDETMNHSLSLSISEQDINQTLYDNLLAKMDSNTKSLIPQAYLQVNKDNYTFVVELNAYGFFKSRLFIVTGLALSDNPQGLMFELKDLKIARLGGVQNIALGLLKSAIDDTKLTNIFSQSMGLSIESHLYDGTGGKRYLFYSHDNFVKDMNQMINLGSDATFFKDFIIDMFSNRKFTFDFYKSKGINGLMSLTEFHDNEDYGSYNDYIIDFASKNEINTYLPTMLKDGNVNESNIETYRKYLSFGYSQLTASEKTTIDGASFLPTLLGKSVVDYSTEREAKYASKGKALDAVEIVEDIVSKQVTDALTYERCLELVASPTGGKVVDAVVKESQLHDVLKNNDAVGYGKTFYRQKDDGSYKVSYINVDNLYTNIVKNNMYFAIGIDINGYETTMFLSSILQSGGNGKMYFKLDGENTYFGTYKMGTTLFTSFSSLLGSAMGSSSWLSYDSNNKQFVVDFSDAVNNNEQIKFLKANGLQIDIGISTTGASIASNGELVISINASRA